VISILSKPREQICIDDIHELISSGIPEGEQIEYKEGLSRKGNNDEDDWLSGGKLGERAKRSLIKQVVALTNTNGGVVVLGIGESHDKPPVAKCIAPIPRCAELANDLTSVFFGKIEPHLPSLEVFPIKTNEESGLVVIRVGKSRQAPHRDTTTLQCYVRRNDQSWRMTMREIQDATLNTARGLEKLDREFAKRNSLFQKEFKGLVNPEDVFGIRLSAIPVSDNVWVDRVFDQRRIIPPLDSPWTDVFEHQIDSNSRRLLSIGKLNSSLPWRPILRGVRSDNKKRALGFRLRTPHFSDLPQSILYNEIHCNGLVELGLVSHREYPNSQDEQFKFFVSPDLILSLFANLLTQLHRIRTLAESPMAEYAIEVFASTKGTPRTIGYPDFAFEPVGEFPPDILEFPRYLLTDVDDFPDRLNLFFRDLYNALGQDLDPQKRSLSIKNWPPDISTEHQQK